VEGTVCETTEDFERRIFLGRAEVERAANRLSWCRRMKDKGYVPASMVSAEAFRHAQSVMNLNQEEAAYGLFKRFTAPKTTKVLQGDVVSAETTVRYQQLRFARNRERLALLEKQVENCTIRAPHDGFVVYANKLGRDIVIEPGVPVRQHQQLFYLPDLSEMEVVAMLHESIVDEVTTDLRANVQVEGVGNRRIDGHVTSVAPIPTFNWRSDVNYFEGIVKLENIPEGLRPGMTAEVEIEMPSRGNVLAVPSEAITLENGHDVCFVFHDEHLERREVKVGKVTRNLAEVTEGLAEGEQVVLNVTEDDVVADAFTARTDPPSGELPSRAPVSPSALASAR
jgi:HlyD family secretion protein